MLIYQAGDNEFDWTDESENEFEKKLTKQLNKLTKTVKKAYTEQLEKELTNLPADSLARIAKGVKVDVSEFVSQILEDWGNGVEENMNIVYIAALEEAVEKAREAGYEDFADDLLWHHTYHLVSKGK